MSEMDYIKKIPKRCVIAVALIRLAVAVWPAAGTRSEAEARARRVTIYRDSFGVPHVFAPTDADSVFGFACAQAEDDFRQKFKPAWFTLKEIKAHTERVYHPGSRNDARRSPSPGRLR
jgi:Penicillin amidase